MPAPNQMPAEKIEPDSDSARRRPVRDRVTNTLSDKLEQSTA